MLPLQKRAKLDAIMSMKFAERKYFSMSVGGCRSVFGVRWRGVGGRNTTLFKKSPLSPFYSKMSFNAMYIN